MPAGGQPSAEEPRPDLALSPVAGRRSTLIALGLLVLFALMLPALGYAQDEQNRAGLVVRHGDGQVVTACVVFPEPSISGIELLRRSGLSYLSQGSGMGEAVCKLDGEGCEYPTENCFCKREGGRDIYWAYSSLRDGAWLYSPLGASSVQVKPGGVEGWAWGSGSSGSGAQPPALSFEQVCAPAGGEQPAPPEPVPPELPTLPPATEPPPPTEVPALPTPAPPTQPPAQPSPVPALPTEAPAQASPTEPPTAVRTAVAQAPTSAPTTAPTSAPTVSAPTASAGQTATTTQAPTASLSPSQTTAPIPTPTAAAGGSDTLSYAAFGALALALLGGIGVALLRRR